MNHQNSYLNYFNKCRDSFFSNSPFNEKVCINENSDKSISFTFCGQKPLGFKLMKEKMAFIIKNDYYKLFDLDTLNINYEISNLKSMPDFTRIILKNNLETFKTLLDYIFSFSEKYVDEHYIPEYTFDCCSRYMECSNKLKCVQPNYLYSKCCNYNTKQLKNGRVFFGKNRNI